MIVLRLVIFLTLISIGSALAAYLFTHNKRYLGLAWQIFRFAMVFLMVFGALFALERIVLI